MAAQRGHPFTRPAVSLSRDQPAAGQSASNHIIVCTPPFQWTTAMILDVTRCQSVELRASRETSRPSTIHPGRLTMLK